jgi:hypothetical protein
MNQVGTFCLIVRMRILLDDFWLGSPCILGKYYTALCGKMQCPLSANCHKGAIRDKVRSTNIEIRNKFKIQMLKIQNNKFAARGGGFCFGHLYFGHLVLFRVSDFEFRIYYIVVLAARFEKKASCSNIE